VNIIPVILSGGSGVRLWPLSRKQYPKQYLPLLGSNTMLQETILRLNGLSNLEDPIIVCNWEHRFLVLEQCQQINVENPTILLEPVGKNTAPAIAGAALQSIKQVGNSILLILSADHVIQDIKAFHKAIDIAVKQAYDGQLVTFGIPPVSANIHYGYIKLSTYSFDGVYKVEKFVEKPNIQMAQSYIEHGGYLWNSGMFVFQSKIFVDKLAASSPNIVEAVKKSVDNATTDFNFICLEKKAFELSPSNSIDYALMEKADSVVVPLDVGWSDIGSWSALYDIGVKDENNNVIKGDVIVKDTTNTYIHAENRMVTAIGVNNLVIVDTSDAILISAQDKASEVKEIVSSLKAKSRGECNNHRKVYRPWGWYDSIESGDNFQVKMLYVNPGAKLSLQMHYKRAEHWVVVDGTATATNGKEVLVLKKGDSTYIPLGVVHALENKTNKPLKIIEVQSGAYLGEDDIVRFEDMYNRRTQ
jgi:mannose-1-phosphate guanylyltransferase/mannose-6-phosphate isomerase